MKLIEVTFDRYAELFTSALRGGIAGEATNGYKTDDGYFLFIEPELNKVEALYQHMSIITMMFYKDNKTWDEACFGEIAVGWEQQVKMDRVTLLYEQVQSEKGERKLCPLGRTPEEKNRLGLIDFDSIVR